MPKKRDTHIPTFVELAAKLRMDPAAHKPTRMIRDRRKRREANRIRRDIESRRDDG